MRMIGAAIGLTVLLMIYTPAASGIVADGIRSQPSFLVQLQRNSITPVVDPEDDKLYQITGVVQCTMESIVPGQKVVLSLATDAGPWSSNIWPSELEFTREFPSKDFILNVTVPPGTSTSETHPLTINGHWTVEPGTKQGDMQPFTTGIYPRPYSAVNLTVKGGDRRTAPVGSEVDFTIIVRNTGNIVDHYLVTVACDGDCHAWTEERNITVMEKGSSEIVFTVYQEKGAPGARSFVINAVGMYPGSHGHGRITVYLDTKFGAATLFVYPWGYILLLLSVLLAVAASFFMGRWVLRKRRIGAIRRRHDHS